MKTLYLKELRYFFTSLIGYLIVGAYLILNVLSLWFLDTNSNLFNTQIGVLDAFFIGSAWLFMLMIPALSMGRFSEEIKNGTLEILCTKPLSIESLVVAKWLAVVTLLLLALLPTLLNAFVVSNLLPEGDQLDYGRLLSGYLGLFLLAVLYSGITLFYSTVFTNQATVFLTAALTCFAHYYLWGQLAVAIGIPALYQPLTYLGLESHLFQMSSGLMHYHDLLYFALQGGLLLFLLQQNLKRRLEL